MSASAGGTIRSGRAGASEESKRRLHLEPRPFPAPPAIAPLRGKVRLRPAAEAARKGLRPRPTRSGVAAPNSLHRRRTELPKHIHDLGFEWCQPVALSSRRHVNKPPIFLGGYMPDGSLSTKSLGGCRLFVLITAGNVVVISLSKCRCRTIHSNQRHVHRRLLRRSDSRLAGGFVRRASRIDRRRR
jgi:hypothetical protein